MGADSRKLNFSVNLVQSGGRAVGDVVPRSP